jgi:SOS-response transcriptional repressor LexA
VQDTQGMHETAQEGDATTTTKPLSTTPTTRERVMAYLGVYRKKHQRPPTVREIMAALELSSGSVTYHLDMLEAEGVIRRDPGVARNIRIQHIPHSQ